MHGVGSPAIPRVFSDPAGVKLMLELPEISLRFFRACSFSIDYVQDHNACPRSLPMRCFLRKAWSWNPVLSVGPARPCSQSVTGPSRDSDRLGHPKPVVRTVPRFPRTNVLSSASKISRIMYRMDIRIYRPLGFS